MSPGVIQRPPCVNNGRAGRPLEPVRLPLTLPSRRTISPASILPPIPSRIVCATRTTGPAVPRRIGARVGIGDEIVACGADPLRTRSRAESRDGAQE